MYNDEGQYSPVGSLENCSILEADNDLGFLNDLDSRFAYLALSCSPPAPKLEQVEQIQVKAVETSTKSECLVASSAVQVAKFDQPLPQQSTITSITETINKTESVNSNPTLLMQQQPLYCLVERQVPSTVIFAEEPVQGMYLINGLVGTQELVLQGGNILQKGVEQQGMYLIDGMSMLPGNIMLGNCSNLVNADGLAVSHVLVQGEKARQHHQVSLTQDAQVVEAEDNTRVESVCVQNTKHAEVQNTKPATVQNTKPAKVQIQLAK